MLRIAFVDDVEAAKDFTAGDTVRKTDFRGFFPTPYAGRVVFVDYRNGTVQVQWPWGSEQEHPTELIRDTSGTVMPPEALDQTYSSWSQSRFQNDKETLKADAKWEKKLTASVVSRYEAATTPVWRAACMAHYLGWDEITAFKKVSSVCAEVYGDDAVRLTVSNLYDAPLTSRLALYWKNKGRQYKVTQSEKRLGKIRCPRCGQVGMKPRTYRAGKKVLTCAPCGFSISPKDLIWDNDPAAAPAPAAPPPAVADGLPVPSTATPKRPGKRAKKAALDLVHIAALVAASNPDAASRLAVAAVAPMRRVSVVNPGVKGWEYYLDEMLSVLKSLDQELGSALDDYETAEEFSKFFEDGLAEEDELRKILDSTKKLGKVASRLSADDQTSGFGDFFKTMKKKFQKNNDAKPTDDDSTSVPTQYRLDDKAMDDFVEGSRDWLDASKYVEMEYAENRDFFDGANALLADMDEVRIEPTRDKIRSIRDRIPKLVKRGQDILKGAREHLNAQTVDVEDEDGGDVNPDKKGLDLGEGAPPKAPDNHGPKDGKHLQWTVKHYVDMLRESLDDPAKMTKYLKELYNEVGPQLKAASDVRAEARRVITPKLLKLAQSRPATRAVLLPILRVAAGR